MGLTKRSMFQRGILTGCQDGICSGYGLELNQRLRNGLVYIFNYTSQQGGNIPGFVEMQGLISSIYRYPRDILA